MAERRTLRFGTREIAWLGLLTALEVLLSRFLSFSAWNMKIGFAFVPVAAAAVLFGAAGAAVVGGLGDAVGALLFPIGQYFPGFTLTAALSGAVLGWFLHGRQSLPRVLGAAVINQLLLGLWVNTLWISILYGSGYWGLFAVRAAQCAVMIPMETAVLWLLIKAAGGYLKKEGLDEHR